MTTDPFNLQRFVEAQADNYAQALSELRRGRKTTHWIWYVFPQLDGLGSSEIAKFYAIKSIDEAVAYLQHSVLGVRLVECCEVLLALEGRNANGILGFPDDLKFRSSITLFASVAPEIPVFKSLVAKYFNGLPDQKTIEIISSLPTSSTGRSPQHRFPD